MRGWRYELGRYVGVWRWDAVFWKGGVGPGEGFQVLGLGTYIVTSRLFEGGGYFT